MQGEHFIQTHGFHKAVESKMISHPHHLVQQHMLPAAGCRALSHVHPRTRTCCAAPHVELVHAVVEPCVELCLCTTGLHRNVFLRFQCIQYELDILTFRSEMNLDNQSRAFDRRAQPTVTQSWDSHVTCRC